MKIHSFYNPFTRLCLITCLLMFCVKGNTQLIADFTATPLQGCAPLVVQFADASVGSPTSWFWDMGNGNTSVSPTPGTIYFAPGVYTVKLVVTNATGADSVTQVNYITVYDKPAIDFTVPDSAGCRPFYVQFSDLTTPGSGSITQWQWDFGDGNTSVLSSPSNLFTAAGSYNITLLVTNSGGCTSTLTKTAYIKVAESPVAAFITQSATNCSPPVSVRFVNTSSGPGNVSYSWDFGDGSTSAGISPTHSFTTPGVFNTVLIVTNQSGCKDTISKLISIGAVTPGFQAPDTACTGIAFSIVNTSAPSTVSAFWTFGDGTTSTQTNPIKIYNNPGTYNIQLVNNFGACKDSIIKSIVIVSAPIADFTYNAPATGCTIPITVSFTSTSTGATTYLWNFGDGGTSAIASPIHTYSTRGVYSVTLTVTNDSGCDSTIIKQNIIAISEPVISAISGLPFTGCAPFTNTFTPSITSPEPVTLYQWDFGDNTTSAGPSPTHTYNATGNYNVTLIIRTTSGCRDTFSLQGAVVIGTKPAANFTALPLIGCAFENVQFTNTSAGVTTSWLWFFGDTTISTIENPLHHYIDTGLFTVTFIAENNGCKDTMIKQNYIYIKPPIAYFTVRNYCDTPFTKRFINKSISALTHLWDFGDAITSTTVNPTHIYALPGMYIVKLRVDNPPCYDEYSDTVYVINEIPVLNIPIGTTCKNTPVTISATGTNPANIRQYLWDFGDGTTPVATSAPVVIHAYNTSGIYTVKLTITDRFGCKKTVTQNNAITVYGPVAKLLYKSGACVNSTVTFTDQSQPYGGFALVSWTIDYGDGTVVTTATPVFNHVYAATGIYHFTFLVKDSYGCTDSLSDTIIISKITAGFTVKDSIWCRQSLVNFLNTSSTGIGLVYSWTFGDGGTSNVRSPSHIYTTSGVYSLLMTIKDRYGCTDSVRKDSFLIISNAAAAFTPSDSVLNCPPSQVSFTNNSTFYTSLKWSFDDGSTSTLINPVHFYLSGGIYNVKLVVYGHGSCIDSITKQIKVNGPQGTIAYSPLAQCAPAIVNFTGTAINIAGKFVWDFGDGTTILGTANTISHTYNAPGKYIPRLLLQDTVINCLVAVFGVDTITVSNAAAIIKLPPNLFCDSGTVAFSDSSVITYDSVTAYSWTFGDGGTSAVQNPVHLFTAPGNYTVNLSLISQYGCKDTATPVTIKVVKSPVINVTAPVSACINIPVIFSVALQQPDTSATQYQWNFNNGNLDTGQAPPPQIYSTAGTYNIVTKAVNSSGCTDTATSQVVVHNLPIVNAGTDSTICLGQSLTLTPSGAQTYIWQADTTLSCTVCTNPIASPVASVVKYIVNGTSTDGCINKDSVSITVVQPFVIIVSLRDTICAGQTTTLQASGADSYTWSPVAGLTDSTTATTQASPAATTIYQVVGADARQCFTDTAYIPIIVYPVPQFNIIPDVITVTVGTTVTLNTTGSADITTYSWLPSVDLSCNNCPQPQATPRTTTTYTGTVTNAGGCTARDYVTINMLCGNANIFVPNTFSPNGDGSNDVFYPRGKGVTSVRNLMIYSRWGTIVFQKGNFNINDAAAGWDGTYKGQPSSADVYVYHLDVFCTNGEHFLYKGDVTLIR